EALGLTKAPRLEISTTRIQGKARVGQRLTKNVTLSTKESRFVYAQAWSNQEWVKAGPGQSQGNSVTIPLHIEVPPRPGETVHADVTFQGNGQQKFVVPVTLEVAAGVPAVEDAEPEAAGGRRTLGWALAGVGLLLAVTAGVGALVLRGSGEDSP